MTEEQPGYAERDQEPTTDQTGGDPEALEEQEQEQQQGAAADEAPAEGDS